MKDKSKSKGSMYEEDVPGMLVIGAAKGDDEDDSEDDYPDGFEAAAMDALDPDMDEGDRIRALYDALMACKE